MSNYLNGNMERIINQAAQEVARSPQQVEAFVKGAELMAGLMQKMGLEQTAFPIAAQKCSELNQAIYKAERKLQDMERIPEVTALSDKAQQIVGLTNALLGCYKCVLTDKSSERVQAQIARAVSFSVWAYVTNGADVPHVVSDEAESE